MYSREGEKVVFEKEVICTGGVEIWLNTLLIMHQQSVGNVISQGLQTISTEEFNIKQLIDNSILQVKEISFHFINVYIKLLFYRWDY